MELTAAVSNVMFITLRPRSMVSGWNVTAWLNKAVSMFVVPLVAPGTAPDQLPVSTQLVVLFPPVQALAAE